MSYLLLTELLEEARGDFPTGTSYGLKRATFPDVYRAEPEKRMRTVLINATPEEYGMHGGGQEAARFNVVVDEWDLAEVTRRDERSISRPWRQVEAVRFGGKIALPHMQGTDFGVEVVGAYVPNEVGTGFVHLTGGEDIVQVDRAFEEVRTRCEFPRAA